MEFLDTKSAQTLIPCSSRKYPYPHHGRSMELPRGRGVESANVVKEKYGAKLEFTEGWWGANQKDLPLGGGDFLYWIFSGTTH